MISKEEKKLNQLIGERLTKLRKKAGYTSQEIFAYDAEVPRALYGRYEKGTNLTLASLFKILKFHGISFKAFFASGFDELNSPPTKSKVMAGVNKPKSAKKTKKRR